MVNWRQAFVLVFLIFTVSLAYFPSLAANVELNDDHTILRWAHRTQIHPQIPDPPLGLSRFLHDSFGRGRCLPFCHVVWYAQALTFGDRIPVYRIFWMVVAVTTSVLFYFIANRLLNSDFLSLLFALSVVLCPAAADVWPHLIRGESIGLFLIAITLFSVVGNDKERLILQATGLLSFLLACLTKESFFLLSPAIAGLSWSWPQTPEGNQSRVRRLMMPLIYLGAGFLLGVVILLNTLWAGNESHGGRSLQQGMFLILARLFSLQGITGSLLSNSLYMIPFLAGLSLITFQSRKVNRKTIARTAAFCALWVIPQLLIYSTRPDYSLRYVFPALLIPLFLNIWGLKQFTVCSSRWPSRCIATLMALWLIRCGQIQFFEARNLAEETKAFGTAIRIVTEHMRNQNQPALIVGPPKTEHSLSVLVALAASTGADTPVFLYQPDGTDRNWFGFENRIVSAGFDGSLFSCALDLNTNSRALDRQFQNWNLVPVPFRRSYLSLRKGGVEFIDASFVVRLPQKQ